MASSPAPPPPPLGEEAWADRIEQQKRGAHSLEQRIHIVELYRSAVGAEPGSIRLWIAYCEYFWYLYTEAVQRAGRVASWPIDDQAAAVEIFSITAALSLWEEGNKATEYRVNDSHELWNRWIASERGLLESTRTSEGVRRITQLYRNRLTVPHATWDDTSSAFSSFLSEYNPAAYEETMRDVTEMSRTARYLYEQRDPMEMALRAAVRSGDEQAQRDAITEYLDWEVANVDAKKSDVTAVRLALGLFSRALTGIFLADDFTWTDLIVFVSRLHRGLGKGASRNEELAQVLPNRLDIMQRAVQHCPWSGALWSRYIICGEQASLSFSDMERIKHAATNSAIDRDGMTAVVQMYAAWCGYLHRSAMDPNATDEMVDIADSGLVAALEAVQVWGERRFGSSYQGDPEFRIERIVIQHLTDKHGAISEARDRWEKLVACDLHANNYAFWLSYYSWEMNLYMREKYNGRSPTPAPHSRSMRTPAQATAILRRAVQNPHLNWPERMMEIYIKHCNDIETSDILRNAFDDVHKLQKMLQRQRRDAAALETAYAQAHTYTQAPPAANSYAAPHAADQERKETYQESPSGAKRKRETNATDDSEGSAVKRTKNGSAAQDAPASTQQVEQQQQQQQQQQQPAPPPQAAKRNRENTSVYVTNLPADVTSTKVRQFFRGYGHVNNIQLKKEPDGRTAVALVEFRSEDDLQSALIRDGKYFSEETVVSVAAATDVTLFVTNFPPNADDAYIRDLFQKCGEIFGIRWPSLKFNTHRRFCYVSFRTAEAAAKAVQLDGQFLEGRYKLSAKYSDPGAKKAREGPAEEGREVHVKELGQDVDEAALKDLFAKYGNVERVRLLRNMSGRSRGSGFVVFATKAEAERAVTELDKVKLGGRILAVDISVPAQYKPSAREMSANPSVAGSNDADEGDGPHSNGDRKHDDLQQVKSYKEQPQERTFALLGIPDTVNIARVRALVEPHGRITKLVLRGDHGGAIVEMEDEATSGKARLALQGTELDGHTLRVGTVPDLLREKPQVRIDRVDKAAVRPKALSSAAGPAAATATTKTSAVALMPPRVKRPVLGSKGAKRGLGFPGAMSSNTAAAKKSTAGDTNGDAASAADAGAKGPPPAKKSNAQFRALFLGSGAKGATTTGGEAKEGKAAEAAETKNDSKMGLDAPAVNGH